MADSDSDEEWTPLSERSEWKDVTPIPQDEGENPPVSIKYTARFTEVMDYFRAIIKADERSARALALTAEVIEVNSANYTAWYYRRLVLQALQSDLLEELNVFVANLAEESPKNYQLWYHRRWLVAQLKDASAEKSFIATVLDDDAKNYHAWAHRQWVVAEFSLWEGELSFVDGLLDFDVLNNSAWNHRFFITTHPGNPAVSKSADAAAEISRAEIEYTWARIRKMPNNTAPWSYLRGHWARLGSAEDRTQLMQDLDQFCEKYKTCAPSLSFKVFLLEQQGDEASLAEALYLCESLANRQARMNMKYWLMRKTAVRDKLSSLQGDEELSGEELQMVLEARAAKAAAAAAAA
eukprot:CAMPEP_0174245508 /NCGR_PEP_ID=MMETSP0417-20130205/39402_1 /TAXON_ID=242541 /ORGANISM="Mayorella sp, Strain BSH-02190019" /LENGTH=350 /DNA_ID=CAMNT_0015325303 /DNA_START=133 /DNA_END=1182 /DNA_ORIENTATION=+